MKKLKKTIAGVTCGAMTFMAMNPFVFAATDFSGRESEMTAKCSAIYDSATQNECAEYKAYLEEKNNNLASEIDAIKNQIASVQGDIEKISALSRENNEKIAEFDSQIANLQSNIETIQSSIDTLNKQIEEKEKSVKERDEQMRERLKEMQVYSGSNNFVDFLMGSSSFSDLLRRSEILGELNSYEKEQIAILKAERDQLNNDKEQVVEKKSLLELQITEADNNRAKVAALNEINNQLATAYRQQEGDLIAERREAQMAQMSLPTIDLSIISPELDGIENDSSNNSSNNNGESSTGGEESTEGGNSSDNGNSSSNGNTSSGEPSNGSGSSGSGQSVSLMTPIQGNWYRSAGTWAYDGGGWHAGMDFATSVGTSVVAPANGIVLFTSSGCDPTGGYLGNSCGIPYGSGNFVQILVPVNGTVYSISFAHLSSVNVSSNQTISQGQVIAYTGNAGNTSGPHCHVEVFNVGNMRLSEAVNLYNSFGGWGNALTFGSGWDSGSVCGSAPCRMRPESFWG